ncbi:glutamine--fructose-6-phosphate transaminase (isomerizing) [Thermovibrio sp.]
MCGIVGYVGKDNAKCVLVESLKRLEYRGYDSAGVALLTDEGIKTFKKVGKLRDFQIELNKLNIYSNVGIGHTRWATHGSPSLNNAHPHLSCDGKVALVHNGIIENYASLKRELLSKGHKFVSETDTEVIVHLIEEELKSSDSFFSAFLKAINRLKGSFAVSVITLLEPGRIFCARKDSPLAVGLGDGENFVASDVPAFLPYTNRVVFLDDGEVAVLTKETVSFYDFSGISLDKSPITVPWSISQAEKGGYKHFMLKEIYEQPKAVADTIRGNSSWFEEGAPLNLNFHRLERIEIVACGTSYHAGLVGKFYIENFARVPVNVDYASEFRYREPVVSENTLVIVITQSGETADTLAALRLAKERGAPTLAVCNVIGSTVTREAGGVIYTYAGPEISVASTKAFTTQLTSLFLFALWLGKEREILKQGEVEKLYGELLALPSKLESFLNTEREKETVKGLALNFHKAKDVLYLGRHVNYPIALEGALKLKEISYIHAEGYPAGEMKHGPIALIDENMPVVFLSTKGRVYEKVVSNMEEVKARKGKIISVLNPSCKEAESLSDYPIYVPEVNEFLSPILNVLPLQLFAYYIADFLGYDVDQPRNLAKSVTVE